MHILNSCYYDTDLDRYEQYELCTKYVDSKSSLKSVKACRLDHEIDRHTHGTLKSKERPHFSWSIIQRTHCLNDHKNGPTVLNKCVLVLYYVLLCHITSIFHISTKQLID